jgi:hypothetical protein
LSLTIEDLGGRVATVWSELRPATRGLVERALQLSTGSTQPRNTPRNTPYDSRADVELSRFLTTLDDQASEAGDVERQRRLRVVADTCALVLQDKTQSAEVFAQLVRRAQAQHDYTRIDALADALTTRFAPSEICELARSEDLFVRELANEALARFPTGVLMSLLGDPVDTDVARDALRRQVVEYGSEEARQIVNALQNFEN